MNTTYTSRQLVKLTELMEQQGVTPESFQKTLEDGRLSQIFAYANCKVDRIKLAKAFGPLPLNPFGDRFTNGIEITVDYDLTVSQMVSKVNFCNVDDRFDNEQFTLAGKGQQRRVLDPIWFGPRRGITVDDAKDWYTPHQAPAQVEDLLAFAMQYGHLADKFYVVAPASIHRNQKKYKFPNDKWEQVAFLYICEHGGLDLGSWPANTDDWTGAPKGAVFLTVRK